MADPDGGNKGTPGSSSEGSGADTVDFSSYSFEQLKELKRHIDPRGSPLTYALLIAELEKRFTFTPESGGEVTDSGPSARQATHAAPGAAHTSEPTRSGGDVTCLGRFTAREGFAGWLAAKRRRAPMYGEGAIAVEGNEIILQGWRRTWLGVGHRTELRLSLEEIRNVVLENDTLYFEWERPYRLARRIRFVAQSRELIGPLVAKLPTVQTAGFPTRWAEIRDFSARLKAVSPRVWVTPALVLANFALYIVAVVMTHRLGEFDLPLLMRLGANFGPYTLGGQWWRLISAVFLHLNLLHLLVNMWALWNAGRLAERLYGSWMFLFLYLASGALANVASIAWDPNRTTAGASGAIFGVLGALLAFLAHRGTHVPAQVVRAHAVSTAVFVLFNLISAALQPATDNAAHVGGLLAGVVLGAMMVRPLDPELRLEFPFHRVLAAVFVIGAAVLAVWAQVLGIGLTPSEQYARSHAWYLSGEQPNLRLWQEIAAAAGTGAVSDAELGKRFDAEIVPFWRSSSERLKKETQSIPPEQREFAALVQDFVDHRLKWALAIVAATRDRDTAAAQEALQLMRETDLAQARLERLAWRASMERRPRALVDSAVVVRIRQLFTHSHGRCVQEPATWEPLVSATDAASDGPATRERAGCHAQELFLASDYPTLDALMTEASANLADLADGSSTLSGIVHGLDDLIRFGGWDVTPLLARTADWRRSVPGSVNADLVEAMVFEEWAWGARGVGAANEVTPQAWLLFAHRTEMAAATLRAIPRGAMSPLWYQLSLTVGLDQSQGVDDLRAIFNAGVSRFPRYEPLYRNMLRILMPRWSGSYEEVKAFIDDVTFPKRASAPDEARYARLYWTYASLERDEINIFTDASARWVPMKRGFLKLVKLYPHSDVIINAFARFACLAGDYEQYRNLRPQLTSRFSAVAWSEKTTRDSCDQKLRTPSLLTPTGTHHP
jgi:membrane associated rhomboid family serine protease